DEIGVVHPIEMVAGEDEIVVGRMLTEVTRRLTNGIRGALVPVRVVGRLLGGEDFDEAARKTVEPIGVGNVAIERRRIELRQDEDATDVGMQAPADRYIDEAVFAADRNGWLGSGGS